MKILYSLLLLGFFGSSHVFAGLRFEQLSKAHEADPNDKIAVVDFAFVNEGGEQVTIERVDSDCSCLSGETDKANYAPGEKGKIRLKYKTGTLKGTARKSLTVFTSDGQRQKLEAVVTVPELLKITPLTLKWRTSDTPNPKEILIEMDESSPMNITKVYPSSDDFDVEVKTDEKGRRYRIVATPKSINKPIYSLLRIETDSDIRRFKINQAFLIINQAAPKKR